MNSRERQQVVRGQQQRLAQLHHDELLLGRGSVVYILFGAWKLVFQETRGFATFGWFGGVTLYILASSACGSVEFLISSRIRWVVRAWLCSAWVIELPVKSQLEQCAQNVSGLEEASYACGYDPRVQTPIKIDI